MLYITEYTNNKNPFNSNYSMTRQLYKHYYINLQNYKFYCNIGMSIKLTIP